jgi:predicted dehydrogenase
MLNIGILGAAGIAPASIIRPAQRRNDVEVVAVASRSAASAQEYAATHGIKRAYGSYVELFEDPDVDLVYNALPPSQHAEWSIAALRAGKDVLCEKPFALNATEAVAMRQSAAETGHRLIEAFHDRYHPLSAQVDAIRSSNVLGDIVSLTADFSVSNPFDPASLRHDPDLGGGALMDLGCYPLHWVRALMKEEPTVNYAVATLNPLGADMSIDADLTFPSGTKARVTASMIEGTPLSNGLHIVGTVGVAHIDNLVFPAWGHSIRTEINGLPRLWTVQGLETYDHQLEAVVQGLHTGDRLLTEGEDSVANMQLIDAIYSAAGVTRPVSTIA